MNKEITNEINQADADRRLDVIRLLNKKTKPNWRYCPRCNEKAIDRAMRICRNCGGVVLFQNDSSEFADKNMDHWFMWMTSISGVTGYFDKSYFKYIQTKY